MARNVAYTSLAMPSKSRRVLQSWSNSAGDFGRGIKIGDGDGTRVVGGEISFSGILRRLGTVNLEAHRVGLEFPDVSFVEMLMLERLVVVVLFLGK